MNIQLRQTGPLPGSSFPENPPSTPTPARPTPAPSATATPQVHDSSQVQAIQGESLSQVVLFPEVAAAPSAPAAAPAAPSAEIKPSANQLQARRALDSFHQRRVENPQGTRMSTDFQMAKLSQETNPLAIEQFTQALAEVRDKLSRQPAEPLSAEDVNRLNAALKYFGVMTDGKEIYNLATRRAAAPGEPRRPMVFQPQELDSLQNVSTTLLEAQASSPSGAANPAAALLATFRSDQAATRAVMAEYDDFLKVSESQLADLLPKLAEVKTQIEGLIAENTELVSRVTTESAKLERLQDLGKVLLEPSTPIRVTPAELPALNAVLAPLKLEIQSDDSGDLTFVQDGKTVSEPAFRQAVAQGIQEQQGLVAGLRDALSRNQTAISDKQQQSLDLTRQVAGIHAALEQRSNVPAQAKADTEKRLATLLSMRNDPAQWNSLSPSEQQELEAMIASHRADLEQINRSQSQGNHMITRTTAALKDMEALHDKLEAIQETTRNVLNQLNELLFKGDEMLKAFGLGTRSGDARTAELIAAANELASTLNLSPHSRSHRLSPPGRGLDERSGRKRP